MHFSKLQLKKKHLKYICYTKSKWIYRSQLVFFKHLHKLRICNHIVPKLSLQVVTSLTRIVLLLYNSRSNWFHGRCQKKYEHNFLMLHKTSVALMSFWTYSWKQQKYMGRCTMHFLSFFFLMLTSTAGVPKTEPAW